MSKIGPHIIRSSPAALKWARNARIVKAIDNPDALRGASSAAILVHRHYFEDQSLDRDPTGVANEIISSLKGFRDPRLVVEVFNEIGSGGRDRYIKLLRAVVAILHVAGLKVAGPSWSRGDYDQGDWDVFRAAGWAGCNYVSLHCYWGREGFTKWEALRYRNYWRPGDPPILITECGIDNVEGGTAGWKLAGISAEQYVAELRAYDAALQDDAYVRGATVFSAGPSPDWANFDVDELVDQLIQSEPIKEQSTVVKMTPGFDVSNNNGTIDWSLAGRVGFEFGVVKVSEGETFIDSFFRINWEGLKAAGMLRGAYQFGRPSAGSGHKEAQVFLSRLPALEKGDFLVLDVEDTYVAANADLLAYCLDFLGTVEAAVGFKPLLYSGLWYMKPHNLIGSTPDHLKLAQYGLWIADYDGKEPETPSPWPFYALWQYSASGTVPGIVGEVDLDLFNGSRDLLAKYGKPA